MTDQDTSAGGGTGTAFDGLLGDIGELAKGLPTAENTAAGAADAAGADGAGGGEAGAGGEGDKAPAEGEAVVKSFRFVDAEGKEHEAIDGEALVKSLIDRIETNEAASATVFKALTSHVATLGNLVKSQAEQLAALSAGGVGRKATLSVNDRPAGAGAGDPLAKSQPGGGDDSISGEEFLNKALAAQALGAINGVQVSECEAYINKGQTPPVNLVKAVLDATAGK